MVLAFFLLILNGSNSFAQSQGDDRLQQQLNQEPTRLNFNPILMRERSAALLDYAVEHEDCDSLHLAAFLAMQSDAVMDEAHDPKPFEHPWACEWRHGQLHYVHGVLCYNEEDYECAARDFRSAAAAAALFDAPDQQIFALHALGSVEMNRRNYGEALDVFEKAYALDPDYHMPTHLNNLAYANFISGDCAAAIRWCDLATQVLETRSKEWPKEYFVGDSNVILLTRLLVALSQEDEVAMQAIIDQINFRDPFAGREMIAIAAVTQALQATDRPRAFAALRPTFESWISDLDSATIAEDLGANCHLFAPWHPVNEPISSEEWSALRQFPSALRGLPSVTCSAATAGVETADMGESFAWDFRAITIVLCVMLAGSLWFLFGQFRFARALRATFNAVPAAQKAILDQALYMPSTRGSLLRGRALVALRMLRQQNELAEVVSEGLSGQERFAILGLKNGKAPRTVARESGLSIRAVKALGVRAGIAAIALVMVVATISTNGMAAPMTLPADSAWQWLQRGDSASWFSALQSGVSLTPSATIPDAVTCAFLPMDERPLWCQQGEAQLWRDLRRSVVVLDDERVIAEGIASSTLNPETFVSHWANSNKSEWENRAIWAFCVLFACLVSGFILFFRNRSLLTSLPDDVVALDELWAKGSADSEVSVNESLKVGDLASTVTKGKWSLLNASEQEVAIYLAEGLTATTIADRMSCTTRYIYNIRSSIRKKWELDAEDDLISSIGTHQPVG